MKPAPFDYVAPATLEEALGLLDEDSRPLAGGQSFVPVLNFRLTRPARLVDLNRIEGADDCSEQDGTLRIGMLARQARLEGLERWPLLREAVRHVGHPQTRNRGTVCGSCAHGDPAAELPAALAALGARFHLRSPRGRRTLGADALFVGYLTTALEPDELLVEIEVPPHPEGWRFVEHARTHGDWADAGAAVAGGRIVLFGVASTPVAISSLDELDGAVEDPWKRAFLRKALGGVGSTEPPESEGAEPPGPRAPERE
ncbi:MAG TPA: FAD binding domain-containing protein [Gaiellaceae bacterium]|nr:FAD binding domain-containing protein [Gaiellaceae bacterium]